ncbi:MAG: NUDIX hydrolase [Rhizobiaceae bacterium]|nr:NUDIX hydrolase [Rhizobiaceae bacterium]
MNGKFRMYDGLTKWKVLDRERVFHAPPYVSVFKEKVAVNIKLEIDDFYRIVLRSFVTCVPFLPNGNVLMLHQYKHGPGEVTLTFPGGFIEEREPAELACARELLEETGYEADSLNRLGSFTDNGNQQGCKGTFFLAEGCRMKQLPDSGDLEDMVLVELEPAQIDRAIANGQICITHHALAWLLARQTL